MIAVCSPKPRASVQNNHSKGNQHWRRDVYHLRGDGDRTLCGVARDVKVLVRFRDGSPHYCRAGSEQPACEWSGDEPPRTSNWHWASRSSDGADIVSYHIVSSQAQDVQP